MDPGSHPAINTELGHYPVLRRSSLGDSVAWRRAGRAGRAGGAEAREGFGGGEANVLKKLIR